MVCVQAVILWFCLYLARLLCSGGGSRSAAGCDWSPLTAWSPSLGFVEVLGFTFAGLDPFFLHSQGSRNPVEFHVEATGVADRFSLCVSPPQGGGGGVTVGAGQTHPPGGRQPSLGFDEGSVDAVHLVVQSAGITQVVACTISPPEGCRHRPTVHTLSPLGKVIEQIYVWVPRRARSSSGLETVQHRTIEGRRRPRSPHVGAHVGRVGAVVGPAEAPGAVVLPPVCGDVERAAVGLPGRGHAGGQRRAGGEGEARRHRGVVVGGHRVRARLRPGGVARHRAALLRRAGRLEVRQRRDHGGDDPGGGHVHRGGARRGVVEESGLVGRGSVVGCHYALVHILSLELHIRSDRRDKSDSVDAVTHGAY